MSLRRLIPAVAVAGLMLALAAPAPAQKPFDDPVLERMRKDIFFLASPECEGRGIDTKGIEKAADYIADSFKASGLKPAARQRSASLMPPGARSVGSLRTESSVKPPWARTSMASSTPG